METRSPDELRRLLESAGGRALRLELTDNRVSYLRLEPPRDGAPARVRLQRAFLAAPEATLAALGEWLGCGRGGCPAAVRAFVRECARRDSRPPRPPGRARPRGRVHDLAGILAEVAAAHFGGAPGVSITWGRPPRAGRRVRSRQLGRFDARHRRIAVSPALDRPEVPRWFLAFVVFHELLHWRQPVDRLRHDRAFRAAERSGPHYLRAMEWQRAHHGLLTRPARGPA